MFHDQNPNVILHRGSLVCTCDSYTYYKTQWSPANVSRTCLYSLKAPRPAKLRPKTVKNTRKPKNHKTTSKPPQSYQNHKKKTNATSTSPFRHLPVSSPSRKRHLLSRGSFIGRSRRRNSGARCASRFGETAGAFGERWET